MKDNTISVSEHTGKSNSLKALRIIKISLLVVMLGICVVGKRKSTWPLVSWALYSEYSARFKPPEPSASAIELRVRTTTGDTHVIKPERVIYITRDSLAHDIVQQAFNDEDLSLRDASRRYLIGAISKSIPKNSKIETIQAWKLAYRVEPLEVPPIQVENPASEVMLDSFSTEDLRKN